MPIINIKLPNGDIKKGEIVSTASIGQIKEEIINALLPDKNHNDYNLVHLANNESNAYNNYSIQENDTFLVIPKREAQGNALKLL